MKSKTKEWITIFLIQLILSLPFYTTNVYATINSVSVKGSNGIEGFSKQNDFLTLNVQASIAGDTITNDQVALGSGIQFNSCAPSVTNGYDCTLRFPGNGTQSFDVRSVPLAVSLFKDDKTLDDSKVVNITIDNKPPQVQLITEQKFSSQQNVVINYDAADYACDDPSCNNLCAGLKNIQFFTLDGSFSQTIDINAEGCNQKSSISIDPKTFPDGMNSVFAKATDKLNQISDEQSVTFEIDATPPDIIPNSFRIASKGVALSTFSTNPVPVEISVNISGSDFDSNSVSADLSALNPSQNLGNAPASCEAVDNGLSVCTWFINLNPQSGGAKTITINASDVSGNKESITISKFFSLDDKGPVAQTLTTSTAIGSQPVARSSGNTVIAAFDENTGLSPEDVFLHIGNNKISATSCSKDTNWVCRWGNVNFPASTQISIQSDTIDVLGNPVSSNANAGVTVDSIPPVLKSINISPVGGIVQAFPGFFKIGDKIAVVANVSEENDVFATADFSRFITGASNAAGNCEKTQGNDRICTWLSDSINLQANDVIKFNFSDNAGNALIVTKSLKTYGLDNTEVPDYWSSTVECSPKSIDRSLGPLINQRIYCQVALTPKSTSKSVSTVFIGPASCSGDISIVDSVETFNTESGSASPVVKIILRKDDFKIDSAKLSCSFNIFTKVGTSTDITKNPEIENINVNVQFFNLPLGEVSSEVQRKIDDAKKDAKGIFKLIGTLNKLMNYAKKICQLMGTLYNIVYIAYSITILFATATDACSFTIFKFFGFVCEPLNVAKASYCTAEQALKKGAQESWLVNNKFCQFVNCQWAPWVLGDWQKFIKGAIDKLPGAQYFPGPGAEFRGGGQGLSPTVPPSAEPKEGITSPTTEKVRGGFSAYMNPQTNLLVAVAFACIPGIIYGLDKYRQIQCLYADCLENAVAKDGIPVTACEDEKAYAKCKYITGELFALFPYTAVLDHFLGILKNAMSNPFSILAVGIAGLCLTTCPVPSPGAFTAYNACETFKLLSTMGQVIGSVKNIIDEGFKIRQDYCSRIDLGDKKTSSDNTIEKTSQGSGVLGIPKK